MVDHVAETLFERPKRFASDAVYIFTRRRQVLDGLITRNIGFRAAQQALYYELRANHGVPVESAYEEWQLPAPLRVCQAR